MVSLTRRRSVGSMLLRMFFITSMHSSGYWPVAVSPESITASARSRTALEISDISARVGIGAAIIDSRSCVAMITGLPAARQGIFHDFGLHQREDVIVDFNSQVPAGDHDRVRRFDDSLQISQAALVLDLGDDASPRPDLIEKGAKA